MMLKSKTFRTQNPGDSTMRQGLTQEQREIKQQYDDFVWLLKGQYKWLKIQEIQEIQGQSYLDL